jgi:DNA-binding XRE family transcriptional regulator
VATQPHSEPGTNSSMTGSALRQVREQLGMSQDRFAPMVGLSRPALNSIEQNDRAVPALAAAAVLAIKAAKDSEAISNLPQKATWRTSRCFKHKPPFEVLPPNGSACGCGEPSCRLQAVRDDDWPQGYLWCFQARGCYRYVYLDATGKTVPSPGKNVSRVPAEICSGCGRKRPLDADYRKRAGQIVYIRRCRPEPEGPPSLQHDAPTYWWEKGGKVERMPQAAVEKLHGRNRRSFPVPKCELGGCPRNGKTMERSAVLHLSGNDGEKWQIHTYRCRGSKPHAEYRVLPRGEVATHLSMGRYTWMDSATGNTVETERRKRPIRKDRIMPSSQCPDCQVSLRLVDGPRKVIETIHGKRYWKDGLRYWTAKCTSCRRHFRVRSNGKIKPATRHTWPTPERGRRPGTVLAKTKQRIVLAAYYHSKGLTPYAMALDLFPVKSADDIETSRRNSYDLFENHDAAIMAELARQVTLSGTDIKAEVVSATQKIKLIAERKTPGT